MQLNELKLLLVLNDNQPLLRDEADIFASSEDVLLYYMEHVLFRIGRSMTWDWWSGQPMTTEDIPYVIYCYASNIIRDRFVTAEQFIINNDHVYSQQYYHRFLQRVLDDH